MEDPAAPLAVEIDERLVRALLAEQHPDLAALAVRQVAEGWDNRIFRLGVDLAVRLPRRVESAHLLEHELRWLPELAALVTGELAVPAPLRAGVPGSGFPWSWSIGPWLPGDVAALAPPDDLHDAARRLGSFLQSFHRAAPRDAPANPFRGIPLAERSERVDLHLAAASTRGIELDDERIRERWATLVAVPPWDRPPVWLHGDLHPRNVLVDGGRLSAVIDFGDLTSGDPATDLAIAWMLFDTASRATFRDAAEVDDDTWSRAEGWALALSLAYLDNTDVPMADVARTTLDALFHRPS
ncbi:MAG: aminoglycoside phosphotransferase [Acidimicrobiales bacterium]|nr:aminoglycoside phosphotransferase [Acidimicrobiales bacterium]